MSFAEFVSGIDLKYVVGMKCVVLVFGRLLVVLYFLIFLILTLKLKSGIMWRLFIFIALLSLFDIAAVDGCLICICHG